MPTRLRNQQSAPGGRTAGSVAEPRRGARRDGLRDAGQINVLGNSLAGYVQTSQGRHLVLMIAVGNVPIRSFEDFETIDTQQAQMIEAVYRYL
jgi:hypothetical protein